ncbi:MAG: TrmH family RNA methyltransferase [Omnitrophica WOR_2 bacterium]
MITSIHNPKIQWVRSLLSQSRLRREEGVFVVEGMRLVEEALLSGWGASLLLYTAEFAARGFSLIERFAAQGTPVEEVSPAVLKAVSDTETPQGVLAVLPVRLLPLPSRPDFLLIADGVRDPGNLGTILRSAAAAGVQAVLLPPGSVDPFSPKVVRSGMGAHFRLPVLQIAWEEIRLQFLQNQAQNLKVYLADASGGQVYFHEDFSKPLALVIGGEAQGAGQVSREVATCRVTIPMPGHMESLNAAVAAAILMFEVVRQRNRIHKGDHD